ncbi:methyltransferase domain-containing protein [Cellulomonas sp. Y8]|uniref:class I SAM-dependent methyltransferase n=1 Tax=Cellulomonas sp. Y8 TaxID=2591145 RepID=UPI0011CA6691|nr:methyltransferase domain-containing protein [Cellulomonas sp. Y8]
MRELVKTLIRPLLRVPVVGRLLRTAQATWRGPVTGVRLDQVEESSRRHAAELARLGAEASAGEQRMSGALDSLLGNVTQVAARQREIDADAENLARSVPVALRRLTRALADADLRVGAVESEVRDVVGRLDGAVPQQVEPRLDDLTRSVSFLLERVEFVRSELLFEVRYGRGADAAGEAERVQTRVKVDLAGRTGPLRVNLGCGHVPLEGYVNVDNRDLPSVDVVADVFAMPFEDGTVDEFFSSHFLEHFPLEQLRRRLLPALRAKLTPGGTLRAVVPDVDAMMRAYVAGTYPYDDMREVVYGGQDYDGDFHYNMFTPDSLTEILASGGFRDVRVVEAARVNGKSLEFEIEATRA